MNKETEKLRDRWADDHCLKNNCQEYTNDCSVGEYYKRGFNAGFSEGEKSGFDKAVKYLEIKSSSVSNDFWEDFARQHAFQLRENREEILKDE